MGRTVAWRRSPARKLQRGARASACWFVGGARRLAATAIFALLGITLFSACSNDGLTISAVFDDVTGLDVGAPVSVSGLEIGRVTKLKLGEDEVVVRMAISPEYRDRVTVDSQLWLQRKGWISSDKRLELLPGDGDPAPNGHRFEGRSGAADVLNSWIDSLGRSLDDPELRRAAKELGQEIDALAEAGREEWERMQPELERQGQELLDEAARQGSEAAEEIRAELERLREEWEGTEEDGPI